ncbi:MAG: hypothetical protein ACK4SY_00955 [Pyrobaculum sp.]
MEVFISTQVAKFIEKRLGDALKNAIIHVAFLEGGVEVEVEIEASVLVDDRYLQETADKAAEFGICIADLVKERGWPLEAAEVKKCWED